jgi:hypothetical protein
LAEIDKVMSPFESALGLERTCPPKVTVVAELGANAQVSPSDAVCGELSLVSVRVELVEQLVGTWETGGELEPEAPATPALTKRSPPAPTATARALAARRIVIRRSAICLVLTSSCTGDSAQSAITPE